MPAKEKNTHPWWYKKFKSHGHKITSGREAVLNILTDANKHLSAEDIYRKTHLSYPAIGLTSVYRTLEILVNMGLVYKFDFGDGRARFELAEGPKGEKHHHHLVCTGCRRVIDYSEFKDEELALLKKAEVGLSKKYNFRITNHLIQFYGLCSSCIEKEK